MEYWQNLQINSEVENGSKCIYSKTGEFLYKEYVHPGFLLNRIYVKGEVSNCKYHTSGHIYFSLKDESGTIACVMFAGQRGRASFI